MTHLEFVANLSVALAAGVSIGFERQWHLKSAGLRTNTLVALGAALYVLISAQLTIDGGDVTRIIGQVVTGVGFLGAGIIFRDGLNIHGLTTAATVWCSSAVGCLAGAGLYIEVLIATGMIIGVNIILVPIDRWLLQRNAPPKE